MGAIGAIIVFLLICQLIGFLCDGVEAVVTPAKNPGITRFTPEMIAKQQRVTPRGPWGMEEKKAEPKSHIESDPTKWATAR